MVDLEQLQILQQGVAAWNAWREQHEDIRPDLCRANLSRAISRGLIYPRRFPSKRRTALVLPRRQEVGQALYTWFGIMLSSIALLDGVRVSSFQSYKVNPRASPPKKLLCCILEVYLPWTFLPDNLPQTAASSSNHAAML